MSLTPYSLPKFRHTEAAFACNWSVLFNCSLTVIFSSRRSKFAYHVCRLLLKFKKETAKNSDILCAGSRFRAFCSQFKQCLCTRCRVICRASLFKQKVSEDVFEEKVVKGV